MNEVTVQESTKHNFTQLTNVNFSMSVLTFRGGFKS